MAKSIKFINKPETIWSLKTETILSSHETGFKNKVTESTSWNIKMTIL